MSLSPERAGPEIDLAPDEFAARLRADMHACFGSEAGKRVLRHLMTNFHFFESILPGVGLEYYEGQRSVLCHILGSMQADFSDPETMLQVALNASFDYSQYQPKEAQ